MGGLLKVWAAKVAGAKRVVLGTDDRMVAELATLGVIMRGMGK